jgi:hypothetical protein
MLYLYNKLHMPSPMLHYLLASDQKLEEVCTWLPCYFFTLYTKVTAEVLYFWNILSHTSFLNHKLCGFRVVPSEFLMSVNIINDCMKLRSMTFQWDPVA